MFCCCFCTFVLSSSAGLFIVCALSRDHAIFRSLSRTCFIEKNLIFSTICNHSGILGFMTLPPIENENILIFEKSKWVRKQKFTSNIGFFLEFFSQLILTTGSQNMGPDITVYYEGHMSPLKKLQHFF